MKTSKYAPTTPAESLAQSKAEKLRKDKERTTRLLGRLRWKAELLMLSYLKTMEIAQSQAQHHHTLESGATSKQAEAMFKVDFFEFYTLLERYITDCLTLLGFAVSAAAPMHNVNMLRYITNPDLHRTRPLATHAFHANLLEALDDESCPLHQSLGVHEVRAQLGIAKDFRNAWKDADANAKRGDQDVDRRDIQLQDLQLEHMLRAIIVGCEEAHAAVQAYDNINTATGPGLTSRDFEPQAYESSRGDVVDTPFEYMDDAMDLD